MEVVVPVLFLLGIILLFVAMVVFEDDEVFAVILFVFGIIMVVTGGTLASGYGAKGLPRDTISAGSYAVTSVSESAGNVSVLVIKKDSVDNTDHLCFYQFKSGAFEGDVVKNARTLTVIEISGGFKRLKLE